LTDEPIYELDIDLDLIYHLAYPDSVAKLQQEQVKAAVIFDPLAKRVFKWQMQHVRDNGVPAKANVLEDEFPDIALEPPDTQINDLIHRLRQRYIKSQGKKKMQELAELAIEEPDNLARAMQQASRELLDLTVKRGEAFGRYDFPRARLEYDKQVTRGKGPSLGYDELDDHFFGQVGITFLVAPPKTGKSWVTTNAVLHNIELENRPYLYSLELPSLESYWRLVCMAADIPYWKYLKRCLLPNELAKLEAAAKAMDEMGNFRVDKPSQGSRSVAQLVDRALDAGADAIFVDQLQYVENRKGNSIGAQNSTADYFEVLDDFRNWSDHIPIFIVHQFNRSVMNSDKMPEMQQAKGSSAIEEVATLALGLWANKDMRNSNVIELGTLASRNYAHASWELSMQLSRGCRIDMKGEIEEDEENE